MSAFPDGRFSDAQLDDIRDRNPISDVFDRLGVKMRKAGRMHEAICAFHSEKTASLQADDAKGVWQCKGCGMGGNVFKAVMLLRGCSFPQAVEFLGGTRELSPQDIAEIERRNAQKAADEAERIKKARKNAERLWASGQPMRRDTHADRYLDARGVRAPIGSDLRFVPDLVYWGFAGPDAVSGSELGRFPAMLGAIRLNDGTLIGVHRTYLDPVEPAKLKPPGDPKRNRAKKIMGEAYGGSIALGPRKPRMAYGEGIETTLSWRVLCGMSDDGDLAEGYGLAALVSLGNICGTSEGTEDHPTKRHENGKPTRVPNMQPDHDKPGFVPPDDVETAIILGDGDSDPVDTRSRLSLAALRWSSAPTRARPIEVLVSMAPDDQDFSDALMLAEV